MKRKSRRRGSYQSSNAQSIAPLLRVDIHDSLSRQAQIRTRLVSAITSGVLAPGVKLPSSRKLAVELGVSRNTVTLAYQQLIAEGHLEARERSGVYVGLSPVRSVIKSEIVAGKQSPIAASPVSKLIVRQMPGVREFRCPPDWHRYRYPFIEGRYDHSLFPVAEWREASRFALGVKEVAEWSTDNAEADDEKLIDEIRTKLLPRRGITARRDEILITVGEQQALHLLTELFVRPGTRCAIEEPGMPAMRELLLMRGADISNCPVDDHGLIVNNDVLGHDLYYVSPSRQRPTGVTLSLERRKKLLAAAEASDAIIIEDDFECEMNYLHDALPSIQSLDGAGRVIYAASLSKVLAPGVRLGFLVAPREITAAARRLRDLTTRRPPPNNQRTAAFFLSLGHYDTMLNRLSRVYEERLIALRDALNHYRPLSIAIPPVSGGTAYWVKGPEGLNTDVLVKEAEAHGILIEPARDYFADPKGRSAMFRLGVTSIPAEKIRPGIELLSKLMRDLAQKQSKQDKAPPKNYLAGAEVRKKLSGAALLYKTVYGDPCTIRLLKNGKMIGRAGYANEDSDVGEWWIENDLWCRRWDNWAYGEAAKFNILIEGDKLFWLDESGAKVDSATIADPVGL